MATFYLGMATLFLGLATLFLGIIFFQNGYILVPHQKSFIKKEEKKFLEWKFFEKFFVLFTQYE